MTADAPAVLDHVALASRHAWDNLVRWADHLGARWLGGPSGDEPRAFWFAQLELADGTRIELLQPNGTPGSDFLERFLARNGPGPHHLTFKVADFDDALAAAAAAGYDVVGVDRSDPAWQEAFLHPKQSHGIVIQLAHQGDPDGGWDDPGELPPARRPPARLRSVDHLVADLDAAVKLFTGPLAMAEVSRSSDDDGESVTVACGPWRLRLIQPDREAWVHWLGGRPGRLLRLQLEVAEPGTVPGATAVGGGRYLVAPEDNLGTRLLLVPPDDDGR